MKLQKKVLKKKKLRIKNIKCNYGDQKFNVWSLVMNINDL